MTSANMNFGSSSDPRSSSRVLRPPGGGHTDIFGIYDEKEAKPQQHRGNIPKSTISEVFALDSMDNKTSLNNKTELINGENGNEMEVPKQTPQTPQRARVPPGGFSSGLW